MSNDRYENARREVAALVEEKGSVLASRQVLGLLEWVVGELTLLREEMGMGSPLGTLRPPSEAEIEYGKRLQREIQGTRKEDKEVDHA